MTHWGWYWKVKRQHRAKGLCEHRTSIDSFELFKTKGFVGFTINKDQKNQIEAVVKESYLDVKTEEMTYIIPYEKQACNYGGFRYYFRCPNPSCNCRMRKLYLYQSVFLCRKCLKLGYYSQRVVSSTRFWDMGRKIEGKLEKLGGSLYRKPKWMRTKTFEKLKAKEHEYYWKSETAMHDEFYRMFGVYP